jgi:hypothetical protein
VIRAATIALALALSAPAMATEGQEPSAIDVAVAQTYDRECTGPDFPKMTGAALSDAKQTLAEFPPIEAHKATVTADDANSRDHVKFCRLIASRLPAAAAIQVPPPPHDIKKACVPDNIIEGVETPAQCLKAEEGARVKMLAQWSQLPRAMTWGCVDGAPASISADFSNFWRQAVDCVHNMDITAATKMWIEHTQQGQYE